MASKTRWYRFQEEKYTINQHFQESDKQFEFINSTCYFILYIYKCKCNCRILSNYKQDLITCDKQYSWLITFSFNLKVCTYMYTFTSLFWVLLQRKHHSADFVASMTSNTCSQTWHSYRTPFASLTKKSEKILNALRHRTKLYNLTIPYISPFSKNQNSEHLGYLLALCSTNCSKSGIKRLPINPKQLKRKFIY